VNRQLPAPKPAEEHPIKNVTPRPVIGQHIRGLLPAPGQTTLKQKAQNLRKKLDKK
jgi:hypothetical protein